MPRPRKCRFVSEEPFSKCFKPCGEPLRRIEANRLTVDEAEALRLADLMAYTQDEAAKIMGVSRATFGRIVEKARMIITDSILNGKGLLIEGGNYQIREIKENARGRGRGRGRGLKRR